MASLLRHFIKFLSLTGNVTFSFTFPKGGSCPKTVATSETILDPAKVNFVDEEQVKAMDYSLLAIS